MTGPGDQTGFMTRCRKWWACPECRSWRVVALLVAVALMSLGDYFMTLEHLRGPGLVEGNPIARFIVNHGSGFSLGLYKFGTVGVAIGILYYHRRQRIAEGASMAAFTLLMALCVQWIIYSNELSALAQESDWNGQIGDPRLVSLEETPE
jgi:Domain of unknown function (DUF5658)